MPENSDSSQSPSLRRRNIAEDSKGADENSNPKYTPEQQEAVAKIRNCSDYYEILGVDKDAGESELRKQYKKLALQVHPDKNKATGAVEAFKAIGNAFAVLSDPEKRKRYDTYGLESMQTAEVHPQHGYHFEGDITAEELYNMFFHGNVRRNGHFRTQFQNRGYSSEQEMRSTLLQIFPILFIVGISLLSSLFISEAPYSLHRTNKYYYERKTASLEIPYFVRETFDQTHGDSIHYIERKVEDEYVLNIRSACFRERNYKENMIWKAKHFRDLSLETKAKQLRTPSCDTLGELFKLYNRM